MLQLKCKANYFTLKMSLVHPRWKTKMYYLTDCIFCTLTFLESLSFSRSSFFFCKLAEKKLLDFLGSRSMYWSLFLYSLATIVDASFMCREHREQTEANLARTGRALNTNNLSLKTPGVFTKFMQSECLGEDFKGFWCCRPATPTLPLLQQILLHLPRTFWSACKYTTLVPAARLSVWVLSSALLFQGQLPANADAGRREVRELRLLTGHQATGCWRHLRRTSRQVVSICPSALPIKCVRRAHTFFLLSW